jgi:hypothetical protein
MSAAEQTISADEFQALEQKVLRAVEMIKAEREARLTAEADAAALRQQLAAIQSRGSVADSELAALRKERDSVRIRVERLLAQLDLIA